MLHDLRAFLKERGKDVCVVAEIPCERFGGPPAECFDDVEGYAQEQVLVEGASDA